MAKKCARCAKFLDSIHFQGKDRKFLKSCKSCRQPPGILCEYCGKKFLKRSLETHKRNKHRIKEEVIENYVEMTEEQEEVINTILSGNNVRVFAKAGTGKTTMALELSKRFYNENKEDTLIVTYNSLLRDEVRNKNNYSNVHVHNYHTLCGEIYGKTCPEDNYIRECIKQPIPTKPSWGLVIIDEAQDMKEQYYKLITRIILESEKLPIVLIMGDPFQRLYNNAGEWYLNANDYFHHILGKKFINRYLSISFRITNEMAQYININLNPNNLPHNFNITKKERENIKIWWGNGIKANPKKRSDINSLKIVRRDEIKRTLEDAYGRYEPMQSIVLSISVCNTRSPAGHLATIISKDYGEPKLIDRHANIKRDNRMRHYSTIHQMKGMETDLVCVPDLSNYWYDSTDKFDYDPLSLFNIFYVALTRAKKELIVCESYYNSDLFCTHKDYLMSQTPKEKTSQQYCSVTSLLEFVPILDVDFYKQIRIERQGKLLNGTHNICAQGENYSVELSKYIGTAIGLMIAVRRGVFVKIDSEKFRNDFPDIYLWINTVSIDGTSWINVIKYSVALEVLATKFSYLWLQITEEILRENIDIDFLEGCVRNTDVLLDDFKDIKFEQEVVINRKNTPTIVGRCDIYADGTLIELKVSSMRREEHVEQVLMYASMLEENGKEVNNIYLYYPNMGELHQIKQLLTHPEYINKILTRKFSGYLNPMMSDSDDDVLSDSDDDVKVQNHDSTVMSKHSVDYNNTYKIERNHYISMKQKVTEIYCKAVKKDGKRCKNKAKDNGYCGIKAHSEQHSK